MDTDTDHEIIGELFAIKGFLIWRLFKIMPSTDNLETIELKTVDAEKDIDEVMISNFIAISRAWQEPQETPGSATIMFNGQERDVPHDVDDMLQQFRNREDCFFWEESLCTNRDDFIETSTRFRVAQSAFEASRKVIVWLGKDNTPTTTLAMDILAAKGFPACLDPARLPQNAKKLEAIDKLVHKPWFKNAESFYAIMTASRPRRHDHPSSKVYLRSGSSEVHFPRLYEAWESWDKSLVKDGPMKMKQIRHIPPLFYNIPFFRALKGLESLRLSTTTPAGASQLQWIVNFNRMGFEAQDAEDLLTMFQSVSFSPHFRRTMTAFMPIHDIYYLIFSHSIGIAGSEAFSYLRPPHTRRIGTYSWAPDFLRLSERSWPLAEARDKFNAGFDVAHTLWRKYTGVPEQYSAIQIGYERGNIYLRGFIFDTVGWLNEAPPIFEREVTSARLGKQIAQHNYHYTMAYIKRAWVAEAMPVQPVWTHEGRDAFWRTLICDRNADGKRLGLGDEEMGERFNQWIIHAQPPYTGLGNITHTNKKANRKGATKDDEAKVEAEIEAEIKDGTRLNELQKQARAAKQAGERLGKELLDEKRELARKVAEYRKEEWVKEYTDLVVQRCYERALITTKDHGAFGLAIQGVQRGDSILVARGAHAPLVIRKEENGKWFVVGEAYVHGIMNGEFVLEAMQQKREVETFCLHGWIGEDGSCAGDDDDDEEKKEDGSFAEESGPD